MPRQSHPSNPLALAVLALLFERPMHPYEMGVILKQRHKEESIKLRYGSLYTVIDLLLRRAFIAARETGRDGRRPERTVYEITPAGRDEFQHRHGLALCRSLHRRSSIPSAQVRDRGLALLVQAAPKLTRTPAAFDPPNEFGDEVLFSLH